MTRWMTVATWIALALLGPACHRRGGGGGDDDDSAGDDDDDDDVVGGGEDSSGLARGDRMIDLDASDLETLCEWGTERQGGAGTVHECSDGLSVRTQPVSECIDDMGTATCDVTVGGVEDCMNAIAPDPCLLVEDPPSSCLAFFQCAQVDG